MRFRWWLRVYGRRVVLCSQRFNPFYVKHFQVFTHDQARRHAAKEATRGAYRKHGQGFGKGHTKPNSKTKFNTGVLGVKVLAGVGSGKALVWKYIEEPWGGKAAEEAYRGVIAKALKAEYPGR